MLTRWKQSAETRVVQAKGSRHTRGAIGIVRSAIDTRSMVIEGTHIGPIERPYGVGFGQTASNSATNALLRADSCRRRF